MSCVAVITARGGSKRIPRKNIKDFCGKPVIAYPIMACLESGIFDEVMVSTDDVQIAEISKKYGASVPFMRSEENSNDYKNSTDAVLEVLDEYAKRGKHFDAVAMIYPTAPFLSAEKLRVAFEKMQNAAADSLIPVVKFDYPPQRGYVIENEKLKFLYPEYKFTRSQDLEPMYHDIGQFYFAKTDAFVKYKTVITENIATVIMSEEEVQDIDNESDWKLAEIKYRHFILKEI